jgi:hypothetical protein
MELRTASTLEDWALTAGSGPRKEAKNVNKRNKRTRENPLLFQAEMGCPFNTLIASLIWIPLSPARQAVDHR